MLDSTTRTIHPCAYLLLALAAGCAPPEEGAEELTFRSTTIFVNTTVDLPLLGGGGPCKCITSVQDTCSLRAAVQTANLCAGADLIELTLSGTYDLTLGAATDDDPALGDLDIFESVTIAPSTEGNPISATIDGNHIDRVFDIHPESGQVTLSGLKVMRGNIDPSSHPLGDSNGGCIRVRSSALSLYNVIVGGDENEGCLGNQGGGLYAQDASVTIHSGLFAHNEADAWVQGMTVIDGLGGAIHAWNTELNVDETLVLANKASGSGGGVAIISPLAAASFVSVVIDGNETADSGGGGYMAAPFDMVDSVVSNNFVTDGSSKGGGGLYVASLESGTTSMLETTEVYENSGPRGGGIALAGTLDVSNSDIHHNNAQGGLIPAEGGGIWTSSGSTLVLQRSSVYGNWAEYGAGLFIGESIRAVNSTISHNEADIEGGGLYGAADSVSDLLHCTVRENTALSGGGGGLWVDAGATASLDRSAMFGNSEVSGPAECTGPVTTPTIVVSDAASCVTPPSNIIAGTLNGWGSLGYGGNPTAAFTISPPNSALSIAEPCGVDEDQWGQPREKEICDVGAYENQAN